MKTQDLIKSFKSQAQWSNYQDKAQNPISGIKWLTRKQVNFLHSLWSKENEDQPTRFDGSVWFVNGYIAILKPKAPNGCRQIYFELQNEAK